MVTNLSACFIGGGLFEHILGFTIVYYIEIRNMNLPQYNITNILAKFQNGHVLSVDMVCCNALCDFNVQSNRHHLNGWHRIRN